MRTLAFGAARDPANLLPISISALLLFSGPAPEAQPSDKSQRPRAPPHAHPERRPGAPEDGVADLPRGHQAHQDRDPEVRPQLHLGAPADPGQHQPGRRRDHPERGQRHRQHRRERQHDNLVLWQLRRRRTEETWTRAHVTGWRQWILPPGHLGRIRLLQQRPERRQPQLPPGRAPDGHGADEPRAVPADGQPRGLWSRHRRLPQGAARTVLLRPTGRLPMPLVP